jgi:Domain of unknown function (DUF4160)
MATIDREGSCRVVINSNEGNEAPHVHVICPDGHMKIWLNPLAEEYCTDLAPHRCRELLRVVETRRARYMDDWSRLHGPPQASRS